MSSTYEVNDQGQQHGIDVCMTCGTEESLDQCSECGTLTCANCMNEFEDACQGCRADEGGEEQ